MTNNSRGRPVSERDEPCGYCGDPLFVCPATIRRHIRCCGDCTHHTDRDRSWERNTPTVPPATPIPAPSDPVLLEAS